MAVHLKIEDPIQKSRKGRTKEKMIKQHSERGWTAGARALGESASAGLCCRYLKVLWVFLELSSVCVCSEGYCWMLISSRQCMESMWPWCHTGEPTRPPRRPGRQAAVPTCCGESQGPETSDLHRLFPPHCGWAPPVRQGLMQAMQKLPCLQVSWGHQALLKPLTVDRQHPL